MSRVDSEIRNRNLLPFMRDYAVVMCMTDEQGFDDFIRDVARPATQRMLVSSHTQNLPPRGGKREADELTTEIAANMGLDPKKFADFRANTSNQD